MFRKSSITSRMIFLVAFMAVFSLGIGITFSIYMQSLERESLHNLESLMHQGYERALKQGVESFATQLSNVYEEAKTNGKDAELAVRMAIRHARYDTTNYYFAYDLEGKTIALPPTPSLYGTNRITLQDKRGNFLIQDMVNAAKRGGGFTTYWYPKPGEQNPSPKKAYVLPIKGTNLFVGTGIYIDDVDRELKRMTTVLDNGLRRAQYTVGIGVGVIFVFIVIPLVVMLLRSILVPLKTATANAQHVAAGHLDIDVDVQGHDEITHLESALKAMTKTLSDNIKEIESKSEAAEKKAQDAERATNEAHMARAQAERAKSEGMQAAAQQLELVVERVAAVSEEISKRTDEIRDGAAIQSERIAETATAMEEMNATVLEVARNSGEAASVGLASQTKAQNGATIVHKSIEAMELTQKNIMQLKENMGQLGQQAEAIGNILGVIADIADQTNLLALNAAIEAARAGESGRGFAVVADEVRKLAEKTMGATKEVGDSIRAIQQGARANVAEVEKAAADMGTVVALSNESGAVLSEIVQGVENSSTQIQGIATAAEEQSATSEEINRSLDEIHRITSETTQRVSQTAGAVRELTDQMGRLSDLIQRLKTA